MFIEIRLVELGIESTKPKDYKLSMTNSYGGYARLYAEKEKTSTKQYPFKDIDR